jgi:ATP-dependent HslUV protease ATP-binding subunit HslU
MTEFSPREIVSELDRFIIGQNDAKRAVAIALRNRWRRRQLEPEIAAEIYPKNILMIGPTGVGKTEISRRLAKLAQAPFVKVEATKFTEVGYVGRDVDSIIRDLVEAAIGMTREKMRTDVHADAEKRAEDRVIEAMVGTSANASTKETFRRKLRSGELSEKQIEIEVADGGPSFPMLDLGGGQTGTIMGAGGLNDMLSKAFGQQKKNRKMTVKQSYKVLVAEEADKLLDDDDVSRAAIEAVEQDGIVFLDEIDKVSARSDARGGDVSREGVQRDLLPLIEGATVATKYGQVKTDHILFIASGAFHVAKPSDLLPELQGRLPIRVELRPLTEADFVRILIEPQNSLVRQYVALLGAEDVMLNIDETGVAAIANAAAEMNQAIENIGARRLHTIIEHVLSELSFAATDLPANQRSVLVNAAYVAERLKDVSSDMDLSRYIL